MSKYINSQKELLKYLKKGYTLYMNHRYGEQGRPYSYVFIDNKPGITCNSNVAYKLQENYILKKKQVGPYEEIFAYVGR